MTTTGKKHYKRKPFNTGWWAAVTGIAVSVNYSGHPWIIDQNPYEVDFWST
jgi:hypothetical protein